MKPSEFFKTTYSLQATADGVAADAQAIVDLVRKASQSIQALRTAFDEVNDGDYAVIFDGLGEWANSLAGETGELTEAQTIAMLDLIAGKPAPATPEPKRALRKTRADKGIKRKPETAERVNQATKARAAEILAFVTNSGPATIPGLIAAVGGSQNEIAQALERTELATWVTRREGDKDPVQVYGTDEQKAKDPEAARKMPESGRFES